MLRHDSTIRYKSQKLAFLLRIILKEVKMQTACTTTPTP